MKTQATRIILLCCSTILLGDHFTTDLELEDIHRLNTFAQSAYSTQATVYNTYAIARACIQNNIPGDFIECGVAAGTQIAAMGYACQKYNSTDRKIHLFDSFQGIPLAGPHDTDQPGIVGPITHNQYAPLEELLTSSGVAVHSINSVQLNMERWQINTNNFIYHEGWFQYTIPQAAVSISQIAFLRLDGDLYESTRICLEYFYPKISKGGYIVIDDYKLDGCRKAVHEYLDKHNLHPTIIPVKDGEGPVYWQIN